MVPGVVLDSCDAFSHVCRSRHACAENCRGMQIDKNVPFLNPEVGTVQGKCLDTRRHKHLANPLVTKKSLKREHGDPSFIVYALSPASPIPRRYRPVQAPGMLTSQLI
ncbi:hypothetical protein MAR_028009 [Mya arenaria]|uniref:Uncharacterized protein n=1 Tax=Mya arenaria TaxID=6604 RepID=A0ABY7DDE5_MYAAR|nr:hypothetical protein MAR_028009 [Mya arenaria]